MSKNGNHVFVPMALLFLVLAVCGFGVVLPTIEKSELRVIGFDDSEATQPKIQSEWLSDGTYRTRKLHRVFNLVWTE